MGAGEPRVGIVPGSGVVVRFGATIGVFAPDTSPDEPFTAAWLDRLARRETGDTATAEELAWEAAALLVQHRATAPVWGAAIRIVDGYLVLLHGAVRAEIDTPAGRVELSGAHDLTWVDRRIADPISRIALSLTPSGEIVADPRSDLRGGLVPTGSGLVLTAVTAAPGPPAGRPPGPLAGRPPGPAAPPHPTAGPVPASGSVPTAGRIPASGPVPAAAPGRPPGPPPQQLPPGPLPPPRPLPAPGPPAAPGPPSTPGPPAAPGPPSTPGPPAPHGPIPAGPVPRGWAPPFDRGPAHPAPDGRPAPPIPDRRSAPPIPDGRSAPPIPDRRPAPPIPDRRPAPPVPGPPPGPATHPMPGPGNPPPTGVRPAASSAAPATSASPPAPRGGPTTTVRVNAEQLEQEVPPPAAPPPAPPGTPTPDETQVVTVSCGVLVADDGTRTILDRAYVFGRDPSLDPAVVRGYATPISVDDPDSLISRVQARIAAVGGVVTVSDANSANGTYIAAPGAKEWTRVGITATVLPEGWSMRLGKRVFTHTATVPAESP